MSELSVSSPGPGGLPVLVFDRSIPPEHQFAVFHETTAPLFDTRALDGEATCRTEATDVLVDDVVFSHLHHDRLTMRRTARHDAASNCLAVLAFDAGGLRGGIGDDADLVADPDHLAIIDMAQPFNAWSDRSDVTWVVVPRHRLTGAGSLPTRSAGAALLHRRSPRGRVLGAAIERLRRAVPGARRADAPALAGTFAAALDAVIRPGDFAPDDHSLVTAVKQHVATHLDDLALDADTLCRTFHCSRSSLYRLFAGDGGVARYIREQRLLRCFDDLTRPVAHSTTIAAVATRWGFENPSHFHRLFRAKFGLPPSDVSAAHHHGRRGAVQAATAPVVAAAEIARFHDWAAHL